MEPTDAELIKAVLGGETSAFELLIARYQPRIFGTARKYAPDEATALDLVPSTWQAAISKAWNYDADQPLVPWLVGFLIVETKRERRRAAKVVDPGRLHERSAVEPEHAASLSEIRAQLQPAMESLPHLYRDVVMLSFERGMEPSEIAADKLTPEVPLPTRHGKTDRIASALDRDRQAAQAGMPQWLSPIHRNGAGQERAGGCWRPATGWT